MELPTAYSQSRYYTRPLEPEDANRIASMRQSGLHADHSRVPEMVTALQRPAHSAYTYTPIHALAQTGAEEALPTINLYIRHSIADTDKDLDLSNFAVVARARLLSESGARNMTDSKAQATAKVKKFFAELNVSSIDLNSALATYNAPQQPSQVNGKEVYVVTGDAPKIHPIGIYAIRELADMIYNGRYEDFTSLPEVKAVNFTEDYASALKMRLAPLSQPQRLDTLINELAHRTFLKFDTDYDIQLAINEGLPASQAAATKLRDMEIHHENYSHIGFKALRSVILGVGDKEQAALIKRLNDEGISYCSPMEYMDISQGVKRERAPAY